MVRGPMAVQSCRINHDIRLTGTAVPCGAGNYYQAAGRRNRGGLNADWRYV